jgi:hypothetical protein
VFPKLLVGPNADIDPKVVALWIDFISEVAPFFQSDDIATSLRRLALFLGPSVLALPFLAVLVRKGGAEARGWMFFALALLLFLPLAALAPRGIRWASYAEILLVAPYAALLIRLLEGLVSGLSSTMIRGVGRAVVIVFMGVGFLFLEIILSRFDTSVGAGVALSQCRVRAVAEHLAESPRFGVEPRRILAFVFIGPELLYRTRHQVVSSSYTGDPAGLFDVVDFFTASQVSVAREIVDRRGVDLVLICPDGNEAQLYLGQQAGPIMLRRLVSGDLPGWLREIPLPKAAGGSYRLYEVRLEKSG